MSRPSLPSTLSQACPGPTLFSSMALLTSACRTMLSRLPTPSPLPRSPIVSPSTWSAARKYAKLPLPTSSSVLRSALKSPSSTLSMSSTAPLSPLPPPRPRLSDTPAAGTPGQQTPVVTATAVAGNPTSPVTYTG